VAVHVSAGLTAEDDAPVGLLGGGVRVALLTQAASGADLAVGARYRREGWSGAGEVEGVLSAGRAWGATNIVANAIVGTGLDIPERAGELGLATM
jgi:hypothetical protein